MTIRHLVFRNLAFHWRSNTAVAFGVAIATAVVTGSLVIGDSVKGSLRESALDRLGKIDQALVVPGYVDASRADAFKGAPLLMTQGVIADDDTGATLPNVNVIGVDERFGALWAGGFAAPAGGEMAIDAGLARELGATLNAPLVLTVPKPGVAPSDSLFARRKRSDLACVLRSSSVRVLPAKGVGSFGLDGSSKPRRNVFVSREWLAEAIGKPGRANAVVVAGEADLNAALAKSYRLEDSGLRLVDHGERCDLQSDRLVLTEREVESCRRADPDGKRISMSLATRLRVEGQRGREAAYAVVGASDRQGALVQPGGIALRKWLAEDMGAKIGDRIQCEFLAAGPDGTYATVLRAFSVRRIDPDFFADPTLVPKIDGLTDAPKMGDWDPPFPVDLTRVTPRDEEYWNRYRAAPKAFVSIDAMREIWGGQVDFVTSYRFSKPASQVEPVLRSYLNPKELGIAFRPVRKLALAAAEGSTDFVSLFLALGLFIVVAAAGLASTLMQLAVARRSAQWGLMSAIGFGPSWVRVVARWEGLVVAGTGALAGGLLGVAYAAGLIGGLTRWWVGAIGSAPLWLHVQWLSVAGGVFAGLAIGYLAVALGIRAVLKRPALGLIAGESGGEQESRRISWPTAAALMIGSTLVPASLLAVVFHAVSPTIGFFGLGVALLAESLAFCDIWLRSLWRPGIPSLAKIATRNAAMNRKHSMLVVGLLAVASFALVAVAPNARSVSGLETSRKDSGAGGFALMATSSVPLPGDLSSPSGRAQLGFTKEDEAAFEGVEIVPMLMQPGEDASCLNLARPTGPRILGVGKRFADRDGFTVRTAATSENPWKALTDSAKDGVPAFADSETATWIFHSGLGGRLDFASGGKALQVRIVGLVEKSVFAGDILLSEGRFRELFQGNDVPRVFMIAAPPGREAAVADALRRNLGELGLDVRPTRDILSGYLGVQNAYISTFLALGMLGLLLGTVGLATALARNAFERRKEFAVMLAFGITRRQIARMLLMENGGLLTLGVICGTVSAVVAGLPLYRSGETQANLPALVGVLAAVMAVGLMLCACSAWAASRGELVPALRSE